MLNKFEIGKEYEILDPLTLSCYEKDGNKVYAGSKVIEFDLEGMSKYIGDKFIATDEYWFEISDNQENCIWSIYPEFCKAVEKKPLAYIGGDMLYGGSQLLRDLEKETVESLGYNVYNPQDNKDINDKQSNGNDVSLPQRIVKQDTKALFDSDIIIIEPQRFAEGTLVELGQLKGMRDMVTKTFEILYNEHLSHHDKLEKIYKLCENIENKIILPHLEDIRRHNEPEVGDNRSFYVNAYVKGVVDDLAGGFYSWEEIKEILKEGE